MAGGTLPNPWVWTGDDPNHPGEAISISVPWTTGTRAVGTATVTRTAGCQLGTLDIGDATGFKTFPVPVGSSTITATKLRNNGLNTIDDILGLSISASA